MSRGAEARKGSERAGGGGPPEHAVVIGGGMLGMTLALRLLQRGRRVTLLDAGPQLGGLAAPARHGEYTWDRFYHVIAPADFELLALLEELDLTSALRWNRTRTGFYADGRHYSLSAVGEYLKFPLLSLVDKVRLGATILMASRMRDWDAAEATLVGDWLTRWSGRRVYERLWRPLLQAKLGSAHASVNAAFICAVIGRMYAARRSPLRREAFGYVAGGYATILSRLQNRLVAGGVGLQTGCAVQRILQREQGVEILAGDASLRADFAVLTVPATRVPALCPQLEAGEIARLGRVAYLGVLCASVILARPLHGFYITNITDSHPPFTGVIETTALTGRDTFGGNTLVYLPKYAMQDDPLWSASDAALRDLFLPALFRMYPKLQPSDVIAWQVARAREVMALPTLHYTRDVMPPLTTSQPDLYIANSAQIRAATLNVNETVTVANAAADTLASIRA